MNTQRRFVDLLPRVLMFAAMLALVLYTMHFLLPTTVQQEQGEVALNPILQVGLFLTLTIFGSLIGFWITFGDLVNRSEK